MKSTDLVRALGRVPYFRGIPDTVLHPLSVHAEVERVPAGQSLLNVGSRSNAIYVLMQGAVAVERIGKGGTVGPTSTLSTGMLVGHVSLLGDRPVSGTYRAIDDVLFLRFPKKAVDVLVADEGHIGSAFRRALIMALSSHLNAANLKLADFMESDGREDPANVILGLGVTLDGVE